jgi:hypothetical protein
MLFPLRKMIRLGFKVTVTYLRQTIARIEGFIGGEKAREIGTGIVIEDIKDKSSKGLDYKGDAFKTYTEEYKKYKAAQDKPTSPVNLWLHGHLLENMQVRDGLITVHPDDEAKAEGLQTRPGKKREFLNAGKDTVRRIEKEEAKALENNIR